MANGNSRRQPSVPTELNDVARGTVDRLEDRLDKCYSQENYARFQDDVRRIALDVMGHNDGKSIIMPTAKEAARDWIESEAWKQKTFWIPTVLAGIAAVAAVAAIFV